MKFNRQPIEERHVPLNQTQNLQLRPFSNVQGDVSMSRTVIRLQGLGPLATALAHEGLLLGIAPSGELIPEGSELSRGDSTRMMTTFDLRRDLGNCLCDPNHFFRASLVTAEGLVQTSTDKSKSVGSFDTGAEEPRRRIPSQRSATASHKD